MVATEALIWDPSGLYVDGTIGCAGHALMLLERLSENGRLWGFDWDEEMLAIAQTVLGAEAPRVRLFREPFSRIGERLMESGEKAHGILLDLGLNSAALDDAGRGFLYRDPGAPLDMRMDRRLPRTAADLLSTVPEEDLHRILRELGGSRHARAQARALIRARAAASIHTAGDLVNALRRAHAIPEGPSELSRIYQGLRLWVNRELEDLDLLLSQVVDWLTPRGRLAVISYESLSDRRVKNLHRKSDPSSPPQFRMLTRHVIRPDRDEIRENPRARSAKLRVLERMA